MSRARGVPLYSQKGARLPTERTVGSLLIFGLSVFFVAEFFGLFGTSPFIQGNPVFLAVGLLFSFLGLSFLIFPSRVRIEVYEDGLLLHGSLVEHWKELFGVEPTPIPFTVIEEIFLNEPETPGEARFRGPRGELPPKKERKARELVRRYGGRHPVFVIRFRDGSNFYDFKTRLRDWENFVRALEGRVAVNKEDFFFPV